MNHPFQNVRERLGSILINIFEVDIPFVGANDPECPRIETVIHEILSKINILSEGVQQVKSGERSNSKNFFCFCFLFSLLFESITDPDDDDSTMDTEFDRAVRLFKTGKPIRLAKSTIFA